MEILFGLQKSTVWHSKALIRGSGLQCTWTWFKITANSWWGKAKWPRPNLKCCCRHTKLLTGSGWIYCILLSHLRVRPSCSVVSVSFSLGTLQQVSIQWISARNPCPVQEREIGFIYLNHLGGKGLQQHSSHDLKRTGDLQKFSSLAFGFHHCCHTGQHSIHCWSVENFHKLLFRGNSQLGGFTADDISVSAFIQVTAWT